MSCWRVPSARCRAHWPRECGWTKPAASQQLKVLREAGLIDVRTDGNRRLYRARREGLAELRAFLDEFWLARLAVLEGEIRGAR